MTQIQDEVHRYAISYTKAKHTKSTLSLGLTEVKGIGDKKAQKLMTEYKTREALRGATAEELARIAGVGMDIAEELYRHIHGDDE